MNWILEPVLISSGPFDDPKPIEADLQLQRSPVRGRIILSTEILLVR